MLVELERLEGARFPLVECLPSHPLVQMEGYNGIGKSLTIRLLQLCTGRQTFVSDRVWETFVEGLGRVRVRISDLASAGQVVWELDSRKWPRKLADVSDDWFQLSIDGAPAKLIDVRRLLSVHRLAGDVGLAETLGHQVSADLRAFSAWHQPLTEDSSAPLEATLALLDSAHALVSRVDPEAFSELREAAERTSAELEEKRGDLREAVGRQNLLIQALALSQRLDDLSRLGADVQSQIAELDGELEQLAAERQALRSELTEFEAKAARSTEARSQLKAVQRRLDDHLAHLAAAQLDKARLLERAQLEKEVDVQTALASAKEELGRLVEQRAAIDASPLVRSLLMDLRARLEQAERDGLGVQILLDGSAVLTVTSFRERVERRELELSTVAPSEEGRAIGDQIESASARMQALERIPAAETEIARRVRLAEKAESEINELLTAADSGVIRELESLRERLAGLDERVSALSMRRTVLMIREEEFAGGRTPAEIEADLVALLAEGNSTREGLADDAKAQDRNARSLEAAFHSAQASATEARRAAAAHEDELRRVVAALSDDPALAWLQEASILVSVEQPVEEQLDTVARARKQLAVALERAGRLRAQLLGLEAAMGRLADRLHGRRERGGDEYVDEITVGYGEEFGRWFDDPLVRTELLPDATKVVKVDLHRDRLDLEWRTRAGAVEVRPLDAFSRGEQAFAYTRARLAVLDSSDSRAQNRLIVLDEFGAFIAKNRLAKLVQLLNERRQEHPHDQVLLILPVSADYEAQLRTATEPERPRLQKILDDLQARGYFTEAL